MIIFNWVNDMKTCKFVYNPESGKNIFVKEPYKDIEKTIKKYGYEVEMVKTEYKGHAEKIVYDSEYVDLLICAGGDGTINECITGNLKREHKLLMGILPMGTMNDVGTMLGYGINLNKNLEMLLNGVVKNIDVCLINNHPFVYVACIGKYVDISYATPRELKRQWGKIGYIIYGLQEIGESLQFYDINYKIDNIEYSGKYSFIFITNSNRVGGVNGIYPSVKLDDNMFEVALCNLKNKSELVKAFGMLITSEDRNIPGLTFYKTNNLEILFNDKLIESWCIDGEEYKEETNVYKFSVDKSMYMLLPSKNANKLFEEKKIK